MLGKFLCGNILRDSEGKGGGNILIENSPPFLLHFYGETMRKFPRGWSPEIPPSIRVEIWGRWMPCPLGLFLQWTSGTHDWDAYLIKWIECYLSHLFPTVNLKIKCWLTYCCSKSAGRLLLTCQVFNDCRMADAPRKRGYQRTVSSDSPQSKKINPSGKDCRKRQTVLQVIGVE